MEFFLHPWYMAAGGALVSAPILIHLINRMRFKRVRWAAMEFLLKSQKRNRRRLIIEQLILLALRCLLVLLAGFLVARYIGGTSKGQGATHIVIIDDTPSMADHWDDKGVRKTCMEVGREQLKQLARSAAQAASHQQMRVLLLSDLDTVVFDQRLNDKSLDDLDRVLAQNTKASAVHVDPAVGLKRAQTLFNDVPQGQKILHFVSDFRDGDWAAGAGTEEVAQALEKLTSNGIHVSLIDTAHPYRMPTRPVAGQHDNLAIIDLRPEAHVVAEGVETEFSITLANFSPSDKRSFLHVKVDGVEAYSATKPIDKVPANGTLTEKFTLIFAKKKKTPDVKPEDSIEDRERKIRLDREYFRITAQLDPEETGLAQDNVRDLVVEVRKRVPSLVVGANKSEMNVQGSDLFHLTRALEAARSYEVHLCPADQLDKVNLELYPNVIFLNVAEIKSQKTIERLQQYVKDGGSIAYFLSDKARPSFYNDVLYKQYAGLFPAMIGNRPVDPVNPDGTLTPEERQEKAVDRLRNDPQPRINFPDPDHKMARGLQKYTPALRYLSFDRYWKTLPRHQWETEATSGGKADVVAVLPNNEGMDVYKKLGLPLTADIEKATKDLAEADPAFARYVEPVGRYRLEIRDALTTEYPYNVVRALDHLRNDPGSPSDPDRPPMPNLWENPQMKPLASRIEDLRNRVLFGDPLVVARSHGHGRVVAILTAAGTASKWNDFGGGSPVSWSYPVFIMDLERYLVSEGGDNRVVGDEINLELDSARYMPDVKVKFQSQPEIEATGEQGKNEATPAEQDLGKQIMQQKDNRLTLHFSESRRPGVYTFEFAPRAKEGDSAVLPETRSYAFNIDAARESDLRRAPREKLERTTAKDSRSGTIALRAPGDSFDVYRNRQPDASESPWLYLVFLLILIAEQAMAVHLSFHLKGSEAAPATPGAAAARTESTAA
jgi:hypothetical protein